MKKIRKALNQKSIVIEIDDGRSLVFNNKHYLIFIVAMVLLNVVMLSRF